LIKVNDLTQGIYSRTGNYSRTGLFKGVIVFEFSVSNRDAACKRFALDWKFVHPRAGKVDGDDRMKPYF
jgi:hypothetical protein